eukprot:COSAG01_NODE_7221_length_3299_cov_5.049375_5_plen_54_part_00
MRTCSATAVWRWPFVSALIIAHSQHCHKGGGAGELMQGVNARREDVRPARAGD